MRVTPVVRLRASLLVTCGLGLVLLAGCAIQGSSSPSTATGCTADLVRKLVPRFVDAFNRGDLTQLDRLVADSNFAGYSTDAPGQRFNAQAMDRTTLIPYFAARHAAHERLALISIEVGAVSDRDAGFSFRLTRSADGLAPTRYGGKGEIECSVLPASIEMWAMGSDPWSPVELLPWAAALFAGMIAATGVVLLRRGQRIWRRRHREPQEWIE